MKPPTIEIDDDGDAEWNTTPLHMVTWTHADEGWAPLPTVFDDFLAAALKGIAAETKPGDANWLFLNFEFGRLMVYPSARDAFECTRSELIFYQLFCIHIEKVTGNYLEWEERIGPDGQLGSYAKKPEDVPEWVDDATHEDISRRKWDVVHRCLSRGNAAAELASARRRHAMKMAAFEPCEGRHYLLDLMDPEFFDGWKKYQREQHRYS